jgi:hypothetical protein
MSDQPRTAATVVSPFVSPRGPGPLSARIAVTASTQSLTKPACSQGLGTDCGVASRFRAHRVTVYGRCRQARPLIRRTPTAGPPV